MKNVPIRTKLTASAIGLTIAAILCVGGSFAWLIMSQQPEVKQMSVNVANSTILEVAQAYPENYWTGPPEVGENDNAKTRVVNGKTVADQGVWGKLVDMTGTQIILQEPATYDTVENKLSTVKFDRTGRTEGLMELAKKDINDEGLVYYIKTVSDGNYRGVDGKFHTATTSEELYDPTSPSEGKYTPPVDVKCAGGIAVWMRSNKPTSEEVFLKGLTLYTTEEVDDGTGTMIKDIAEDDILGVIVNTYHLRKTDEAKAIEKKTGVPQTGTLEPFNNYYAHKTDDGYTCTLFAGSRSQQMQPGELYLVEIICYIEGDTGNNQNNIASIAGNTTKTRKVTFDDITCQDVLYAAKVTEENNTTKSGGWFAAAPKLKIELYGASNEVDNKNVLISYKLATEDDPDNPIKSGQFMAFNAAGAKNSETIELQDGIYNLMVETALTDGAGNVDPKSQKYYTVSISDTSMVNTEPDSINIKVDTLKPLVTATLSECACAYEENGVTYHNHDVIVGATALEKNISTFRIGGSRFTPEKVEGLVDSYHAERIYSKDGDYKVAVEVTDFSGKTNDVTNDAGKVINEKHFVIDKTKPLITSMEWSFVDDNGIADFFSKLLGTTAFDKKVQLKITALDDNILSMECTDSQGDTRPLDVNVVKDAVTGKSMTATVTLPAEYQDRIIIKVKDKAGNELIQKTDEIIISDQLPGVTETHTGEKEDDTATDPVWYSITYKLAATGTNTDRVTGFEFSTDGNNWYSKDQNINGITYVVGTETLESDTVTIYTNSSQVINGTIFFRAKTNIEGLDSEGHLRTLPGIMMGKTYSIRAHAPEIPTVKATHDGNEYQAGTPVYDNISYELSPSAGEDVEVKYYQYSLDGMNWYTGTTDTDYYSVSFNSATGTALIRGKKDQNGAGQIRFRAAGSQNNQDVYSESTEPYAFALDQKAPVVSKPTWKLVNYDTVSSILNTFTGGTYFNTLYQVTARATDENIGELTTTEGEYKQYRSNDTIRTDAYLSPDFTGEVFFVATDLAQNTTERGTKPVIGTELYVNQIHKDNPAEEKLYGDEMWFSIEALGDEADNISWFEYSFDEGATWKRYDSANQIGPVEENGIASYMDDVDSGIANFGMYNMTDSIKSGHIRFRGVIWRSAIQKDYIQDGRNYDYQMNPRTFKVTYERKDDGFVDLTVDKMQTIDGASLQGFSYEIDGGYYSTTADFVKELKNDQTGLKLRLGSKTQDLEADMGPFVYALYRIDGESGVFKKQILKDDRFVDTIKPNIYLKNVKESGEEFRYDVVVADGRTVCGPGLYIVECDKFTTYQDPAEGSNYIKVPKSYRGKATFSVEDDGGNEATYVLDIVKNGYIFVDNEYKKASNWNSILTSSLEYKLSSIYMQDKNISKYQYSFDGMTWLDSDSTDDAHDISVSYGKNEVIGDRIVLNNEGNDVYDGKIYFRAIVETGDSTTEYITDENAYDFRLAVKK